MLTTIKARVFIVVGLIAVLGDPSTIPTDAGFYMRFWKFHVDWANPANSTVGGNGDPNYKLPVAAFVRPHCSTAMGPTARYRKVGRASTCSATG